MKKILIVLFFCYSCSENNRNTNINKPLLNDKSNIDTIEKLIQVDSTLLKDIEIFIKAKEEIETYKKDVISLYYKHNIKKYPDKDNQLFIDSNFVVKLNATKLRQKYQAMNYLILNKRYSIDIWEKKNDIVFNVKKDSLYSHLIAYSNYNHYDNLYSNPLILHKKIISHWEYWIIKLWLEENRGNDGFKFHSN